MKSYEMYKEYCLLNGISASRFDSLKRFALEFPEYCSKRC